MSRGSALKTIGIILQNMIYELPDRFCGLSFLGQFTKRGVD